LRIAGRANLQQGDRFAGGAESYARFGRLVAGTMAAVRGNVIGVSYRTAADLDQYHGKLKGSMYRCRRPFDALDA